jgi:hypothetical protein
MKMSDLKIQQKCVLCDGLMEPQFNPMKEWNIDGPICGKCYSKKLFEFYPGKHVRVNLSDD